MNITGTASLISGGSRGLGRALALDLARRGSRVVVVARHRPELDAVVAEIRSGGGIAHGIAADIGDQRAIYSIQGQATALVGAIDIVINNASTLGPTPLRLLMDTECEDLSRVLEVNTIGPFRLTKALAGSMLLRNRGIVVHISSDAATEAYPRWGAYSASKAALDQLSRIWAAELEGSAVRFLSIDPGEMNTAMHAAAIPDADLDSLADPTAVAEAIVEMLEDDNCAPSGARLLASKWRRAG